MCHLKALKNGPGKYVGVGKFVDGSGGCHVAFTAGNGNEMSNSEQSSLTSGKGLVLGGAGLVVGLMLELLVGG